MISGNQATLGPYPVNPVNPVQKNQPEVTQSLRLCASQFPILQLSFRSYSPYPVNPVNPVYENNLKSLNLCVSAS